MRTLKDENGARTEIGVSWSEIGMWRYSESGIAKSWSYPIRSGYMVSLV